MTPREGEEITLALFKALGLPLEPIPTSDRELRPDFEGTDAVRQRYIVETKTRFDSDDFTDDFEAGRVAEDTPALDHDNATEKIVKKASRQLHTLRSADGDIAILCYVLAGFSPEMQDQHLRSTLWGTIQANDVLDLSFQTDCYYLGHTGFLRYQDLDGVIAVDPLGRSLRGLSESFFAPTH